MKENTTEMEPPIQRSPGIDISADDRKILRSEIFHHFMKEGINNDDELKFWVEEFTPYELATKVMTAGNVSPLQFVSDQFFEKVQTSIGFASRGGGKTSGVAVLNVLDATMKPGIEICSAGAIQEQADRAYTYIQDVLFNEPLLGELIEGSIKSLTQWRSGSKIRVIPGTYHGFNSPHPNKTRVDEIELMHWDVLQEGLQMSIQRGEWLAQDTLTSTRKWAKGTMQKFLDSADDRGIQVYRWNIFEVLEKCPRECFNDPVYGDCPIYKKVDKDGKDYLMCGGKAHDCSGWYTIADFIKKGKLLDKETWECQWLNERPSGQVLVYGDYFKDEMPWVVEPFDIPKNWQRVDCVDFGSKFYYGKFAIDPHDGCWYLFWEYYWDNERSLVQHADIIKKSPHFRPKHIRYADPSGRQAILEMKRMGVPMTPANNDVYAGVNKVKSLLQRDQNGMPKLRIFKWCERARLELGSLYCHKLEKDGTPNRDVIVKKDDHASDAIRYGIYSFHTIQSTYRPSRKVKGLY